MTKGLLFFMALFTGCSFYSDAQSKGNVVAYVDPFIGTAGTGHTFPGATLPFGMVKVSPETGNLGWNYCSGYRYEDSTIMGFSHTHLSGTGWLDLGDILLLPFTGDDTKKLTSGFGHFRESASPGYYQVYLKDYGIDVQLTSTAHSAFHRYRFERNAAPRLLIDLQHGLVKDAAAVDSHVIKSELFIESPNIISGYTVTTGWAGTKHVYFVIALRKAALQYRWLSDSSIKRNQRLVIDFKKGDSLCEVKVALSAVSIQNAKENLRSENSGWEFKNVHAAAVRYWDKELSRILIQGTPDQQKIFYTALYHTMIHPDNIADVNGQYRGVDNRVYQSGDKRYFSTLSLWDTYRGVHPLLTILNPALVAGVIRSMLAHYKVNGYLPVWSLWAHENNCMIANHAIAVIAEAYIKGIRDYDAKLALEAMVKSSEIDHPKSDWGKYLKYGYLPSDAVKTEAVSRTLENCYDDWCVAHTAKTMGKEDIYSQFLHRSRFYKNLFDPQTNLMRGRNTNGSWVTPFSPFKISHAGSAGGDYTEANAWQYTWQVQHDIDGLIALMGGADRFCRKLDSLFLFKPLVTGDGLVVDVTGLIGQYVQGNEPCHHVAYLYTMAKQPWKTQEKIDTICNSLYSSMPDGLSGNDDCGQMSAWYIFSSLGFYPVDPVSGRYVFGKPLLKKAIINLGNKIFTISAANLSARNRYVQQVKLNGKPYHRPYISHEDIIDGGTLEFEMGQFKTNPFK